MLLCDLLSRMKNFNNLSPTKYNFYYAYNFWSEFLFERCMRLFVYTGLPETMPQKEIEQQMILQGYSVITDKKDAKVYSFFGLLTNFTGVYYDEPLDVAVNSPIWADVLKIGSECILMNNNSCRNSLYPLIHHYSTLLAHACISLQNTLVNGRDSNGTPIANTEQQKNSIQAYYDNLWNGKRGAILDKTFTGIEFKAEHGNQALNIKDCMEVINNLLDNFYNDIGVKTSKDKKGNMLNSEIEADNPMLLLNIKDMLATRKKGVEEMNKIYGAKYGFNVTVDISEEIKQMGGYE